MKFLAKILPGFPAKDLKPMAEDMTKKIGSGVVALIATEEGKVSVVVAVTKDLTSRINAVDLVKAAAEAMGGTGGGGRPDMARARGPTKAPTTSSANRKITGCVVVHKRTRHPAGF